MSSIVRTSTHNHRRPRSLTPVGVDVGSTHHLVAVATPAGGLDATVTVGATYARALYGEYQSATHRLGNAPAYDPDGLGDLVARYWPRLRAVFDAAAATALEYAATRPAPILAVEDLPGDARPLVEAAHGAIRWAAWCPPVVQAVLVDRAVDVGIPVMTVDPYETSQRCHVCGETGDLSSETLRCTTDDCPVGKVCRDRSAAVSIAKRVPADH